MLNFIQLLNTDLRNVSNIETLLMDGVMLDDVLPYIRVITSTQVLSLKYCDSKRIPSIEGLCELKKLRELDVSYSAFGETLPWCLANLTSLRLLDLTSNHFTGNIAWSPLIHLTSLEYLAISNNEFEVPISFNSFFNHSKLMFIESLNNMLLEGEDFPARSPSFQLIGLLSILVVGQQYENGDTYPIIQFIWWTIIFALASYEKCCRLLKFLRLSNNFLKGPVLPHQNNLTRLQVLYSANNSFTEIPPNLSRSNLIYLDVSANQMEGKIPVGFIGNNTSIAFLAMAGNHLEGPIPIEFCQLKNLMSLDLSENNITGAVPSCFISTNLRELDLSYNQFSGTIPTWIGSLSGLMVLLLQNNNFEGNIPKELCNLSRLSMIDLSSNNLFGSIPPCISEIEFKGIHFSWPGSYGFALNDSPQTFTLLLHDLRMVLDTSENGRDEPFSIAPPFWIAPTRQEAKFTTKGISLIYRGIVLQLFSGINLSYNRLTGHIPPEIGNLTGLKVLNLSHNYFIGTIPVTFSNLIALESLDLSYNHLNGKIPSQLTELYSLAVFNLSYNNLSGRMPPRVKQFGTFDSSSYVGNPLLCGEPLPKCNATDSPPSTPRATVNDTEEDSGFMDMNVFYMSFAGSYVTVVLAIVAILLINPYWRRAWFHLIEVSITCCYYFVVDNLMGHRRGFLWK
ncbi:hypothetical protein RHMOL_Rhmol01G0048400 [Rhododendron molle]|uniref:Uncharacterized protein n=1 Tax=Rhododendron molle TaxID=49168 RepID=A0ACC0PXY0_RHOML|nr:hypothetical protein RHMOL_Rhmol01G0048400 [Rhododendron molle]